MDEIEAGGIPVVMLRGDGQINPDGIRDYDLLVPATVEALVIERHADERDALPARRRWLAREVHRRARGHPAAQPPVRAAPPADDRGAGARRRRGRRRDRRRAWSILLGVGPDDGEGTADDLARKAAELRIFRDDDGPDEPVAARRRRRRRWSSRSSRSSPTRAADAGPGSPAPPRRSSPSGSTCASPMRSASLGVTVATGRFGAEMAVELVNDGPFTIWLDSDER